MIDHGFRPEIIVFKHVFILFNRAYTKRFIKEVFPYGF